MPSFNLNDINAANERTGKPHQNANSPIPELLTSDMTFASTAALFGAMLVLAVIPSVSVLAVVARTLAFGFVHGLATTVGIIAGDILFILLAVYGLVFIAQTWDGVFVVVRFLGGAYLVFLGVGFWRSNSKPMQLEQVEASSRLSSFLTGLLITLGDQKAILFYIGFLPAFLDLATVSFFDTVLIILIATVAIAVAKLSYAYMAGRAGMFVQNSTAIKGINALAGSIIIGTGAFLIYQVLWLISH